MRLYKSNPGYNSPIPAPNNPLGCVQIFKTGLTAPTSQDVQLKVTVSYEDLCNLSCDRTCEKSSFNLIL